MLCDFEKFMADSLRRDEKLLETYKGKKSLTELQRIERFIDAFEIIEGVKLHKCRDWLLTQKAFQIAGGCGSKSDRNNATFYRYLSLIMGTYDDNFRPVPPVTKIEAIEKLQMEYCFPSWEACYQHLKRDIRRHREDGQHIPRILPRRSEGQSS